MLIVLLQNFSTLNMNKINFPDFLILLPDKELLNKDFFCEHP